MLTQIHKHIERKYIFVCVYVYVSAYALARVVFCIIQIALTDNF